MAPGTISGVPIAGAFVYLFVPYFVTAWTFDQSGMPPVLRQVTAPLFTALAPGRIGGGRDRLRRGRSSC